ncbi:GMC family oxidoreductase [Schlegelella sp. S2-27]|uniref:GMC family oxidoreductase n=1 Tax=Caldimonas mangrovi TaxID=2944811 RepID=A0ABT0YVK2_9BURK|nr:GMC family oxidoreductase [Caldimonas mangrovi]MCM5682322.1 GMC family oxidoreductase [Caldimonas mangrovi]
MTTQGNTSDAGHDLVVIGSGFGSLFFIEGALRKRPQLRILVLERGQHRPASWQVEQGRNSDIDPRSTYRTPAGHKEEWNFTVAVGGGTNCWYAQTPRFHPSDFRLHTLYGVGRDWPVDYDELEPYYLAAERKMAVAGDPAMAQLLPRSAPFPLPGHRMSSVDEIMRRAQPQHHLPIATARASIATEQRGRCCATARCRLCPVNAKFNFDNGFAALLDDPRIEWRTDAEVLRLEHSGGTVQAAVYRSGGKEHRARGELFVLGANAIHSPAILLRSGIDHPLTGRGIHEQLGYTVEAFLDGVDNFDGSTITTSLNYSLYDGDFRREHANALIYFENRWPHGLRTDFGRWRQIAPLTVVVEDLPQDDNRVALGEDADGPPVVHHAHHSDYATLGVKRSMAQLERVLAPLPVERIEFRGMRPTESHLQGSLRMGRDRSDSVIDAQQLHHDARNLVVVGSAVFPTGPSANPSLTVAALSLRSAERVL